MVKVALAGTGKLGSDIAKTISQQKKHEVVVLSRKPRPDFTALGIQVSIVDYDKYETLVTALQGVHTVISIAYAPDQKVFVETQLALLKAAKEVGVKRFAPSEFAYSEAADSVIGVYHPKIEIWKAVKESGLQYTGFRPGLFLNFLAHGSPKPDVTEKLFQASHSYPWVLNLAEGKADIPGTGEEKLNLTTTDDIAGFVAASLDTEWTEESGMAGSIVTWNEMVQIAEKITGKKIEVKYHSIEELERQKETEEDPLKRLLLDFHVALGKGLAYIEPTLNRTTGYKPETAEEFIQKWWGA